ncbi:MAG TPA: LexA family transcriptional regulator [Chitinophagaceae bacterium]|nr:LexA family transcriptional regulator [Chitinophagaceae bacterium]HNL83090.1 LexA family transcriptional regulator [Chitinophagaceae bacterium]HNM34734.1 LexA family transcriptional regulator [Chitinophagaceae bacterium]HNN31607.1 LexA family transcriptional regulator [Chitinophagaceae bacterium]
MSYAGKNLRYLRKLKNWTQEEFANRLQIKRSLLGAYEEERAEPKLEVLELVSGIFKLSLEELLLKELTNDNSATSYLEQRRKLKNLQSSNGLIHFVPFKAAAGYLNGYADANFIDELNTFTLPMLTSGEYRAFEIIGDSMMPTPSGSVIVGEKVEQLDDVKNSNTYVLLSKSDGIVYKRLIKNTKPKNTLTLVSDNPVYEPYQMQAQDVLEVWKAVYILQKASTVQRWEVGQLAGMVNDLQTQVTNLNKKIN